MGVVTLCLGLFVLGGQAYSIPHNETILRRQTRRPTPAPQPPRIPVLPNECLQPTEQCINAVSGRTGYLWLAPDHGCTEEQETQYNNAYWDAQHLASWSRNFPNNNNDNRPDTAGGYWLGTNYGEYIDRIRGNIQSVSDFTSRGSDRYVVVSCKDTRNWCGQVRNGMAVGGYAWVDSGWLSTWHRITMCLPFFVSDGLYERLDSIERDLANGDARRAGGMEHVFSTRGHYLLHELMHTKPIYDPRPEIIDEYFKKITPTDPPDASDRRAYGPWGTWALARKRINGGAARTSTNADNYPMLLNALWWWDATDHFPVAADPPSRSSHLLFPFFDTEGMDTSTLNWGQMFEDQIDSYHGRTDRILQLSARSSGKAIADGTDLRILTVGDSITAGYLSNLDGGDSNGYRLQLRNNLSRNRVVFAGTQSMGGSMAGNYFAAWSGQTIQYIADNIDESLAHIPNLVLLHAGTNDMNSDLNIAKQGNDPAAAAARLGALIDKIYAACPRAVILVAKPINICSSGDQGQRSRMTQYQDLIPDIVDQRQRDGVLVQTVDFSGYSESNLRGDCVHPTNAGYAGLGDFWYDYISQIPDIWYTDPEGSDPVRVDVDPVDSNANGGIDQNIPPPNWGPDPIGPSSIAAVRNAANVAGTGGNRMCDAKPAWQGTGQIALGFGSVETWQWNKMWTPASTVEQGPLAAGLDLDSRYVRLADMNGDGKADYVWIDPNSGETICWLNNLPNPWSPAGTNGGVIASGLGPGARVYLADLNGDRLDDYIFVDPTNGSLDVYWNRGSDPSWENGWRFEPHPGPGGSTQLAVGVPHANLATLRFPDINGDGRADYVYLGAGGSLGHWLNTGSEGGTDVNFQAFGGIATGPNVDIGEVLFADMNGDGRDDYLIWDDADGLAGLSGFLNQETRNDGVPVFIDQGGSKSIAGGIDQARSKIRLADMNGDGFDDYIFVDDNNGALWVWWNDGRKGPTNMQIDGLRFADIDGDGLDDYIYMDPESGAPTVFLNRGPSDADSLGWSWVPLNDAQPIASGAGRASTVLYGDIDGDGKDDYLTLDPLTGALEVYLNKGPSNSANGWDWLPIGQIAEGFGLGFPGANVRIADIDGDGRDDYIYLHGGGATTIYRNKWAPGASPPFFEPFASMDAAGIFQRAEEITFTDIDGDGRADYVWTRGWDGAAFWYKNNFPNQPGWLPMGEIAGGVGTGGQNVRYAILQHTGRASYVAVNPINGAIAAWLNGCLDLGPANGRALAEIILYRTLSAGAPLHFVYQWKVIAETPQASQELCEPTAAKNINADSIDPYALPIPFPPTINDIDLHGFTGCTYTDATSGPGIMSCPGRTAIQCTEDSRSNEPTDCGTNRPVFVPKVMCRF